MLCTDGGQYSLLRVDSTPATLGAPARCELVMRLVDLVWQIKPAFQDPTHPDLLANINLMDLSLPVALVSVWFALFANNLRKAPLMVLEDGKLKTAYEEPETPFHAKVASP